MSRRVLRILVLAVALAGCMVGDDPEEAGAIEAKPVLANTLTWSGLASDCAKPNGFSSIGGSMSALFDQGTAWTSCTVTGTLHVPANVELVSVRHDVRTYGDGGTVKYKAALNGSPIVTTSFSADGRLFSTSAEAIGRSLCARPGTAARAVALSFTVAQTGGIALDSVDWSVSVVRCP